MGVRSIFGLWLVLCGVACSGGGESRSPGGGAGAEPQGALTTVSAAEFEQALKSGFARVEDAAPPFWRVEAVADQTAGGRYSSTYTLEANVDEVDTVRYNGTHLFVASDVQAGCCMISTEGDTNLPEGRSNIRVLETDHADATAQEASRIELPEGIQVTGMLVWKDRLIVVGGEERFVSYGESWVSLRAAQAPRSLLMIYDIADPDSPRQAFKAEFDGSLIEVRRIGETIFVISRFTPYVEGLTLPVSGEADALRNRDILAGRSLAELLPAVSIGTRTTPMVAPENCYVTAEGARGYPTLTSITAFPIRAPEDFRSACYNESAYGAYASERAIYLTQHDFDGEAHMTRVHKFSLTEPASSYRGSAELPGLVWNGGQSDFRLSEHDDRLRAVTSIWTGNDDDQEDHRLYVLEEAPTAKALRVVGRLPNASRPEEIGKPGESLYGVRFVGSRAYIVTFERIDPLYVLDLSDPEDPYIAGSLEVAGFSDFLHPVNDELLLGFGRGGSGGLKLELFDVSDMNAPASRATYEMGSIGSFSEALYERHAFTFFQPEQGAYRFAVPAQLSGSDTDYRIDESGLYLFEVMDADQPELAALRSVGAIVKRSEGASEDWLHRSRSYMHDESVFYVRNDEVWGALWLDGASANGPQ